MEFIEPDSLKPEPHKDGRHFVVLPYRVLKDRNMSIQRLRVLIAVCSYARRDGMAWPGVKRLAADCGLNPATITHHLTKLTQQGYLQTVSDKYWPGDRAKARQVIYDPAQLPDSDKVTIETEPDQSVTQAEPKQSLAEPLADPTSLYVLWRKHMQERFNITPPQEDHLLRRLAHQYDVESFEKALRACLSSRTSPPPSVGVLLRS
jgi:DNA-binding transcriptional ArsR family regulator